MDLRRLRMVRGVTLCAVCGLGLSGGGVALGMCGHHPAAFGDEWAVQNRAACDFIHRHVEPPNVPFSDAPTVDWSDIA